MNKIKDDPRCRLFCETCDKTKLVYRCGYPREEYDNTNGWCFKCNTTKSFKLKKTKYLKEVNK